MHKKVLRMALHAISTVRDDQIMFFFYVRVKYFKSNINDRYLGSGAFAISPSLAKLSYILR